MVQRHFGLRLLGVTRWNTCVRYRKMRMAITAVAPARLANGAASNDLEDVTHGCVQCGTTLIRTRRPFSGDAHAIAHRI
jgi:ferredoxin-like protein FixX